MLVQVSVFKIDIVFVVGGEFGSVIVVKGFQGNCIEVFV